MGCSRISPTSYRRVKLCIEYSTRQEDLIPNFEESLQLMSGALLELSPDSTVRFIHLSILEFLIGAVLTAWTTLTPMDLISIKAQHTVISWRLVYHIPATLFLRKLEVEMHPSLQMPRTKSPYSLFWITLLNSGPATYLQVLSKVIPG
jgi:hypothetical protein